MKTAVLFLSSVILWASSAWAIDYPTIKTLPNASVAVADLGPVCSSGFVPEASCVTSLDSPAQLSSCPCVASNSFQPNEFTFELNSTLAGNIPTVASLLLQLSLNCWSVFLITEDKGGARVTTKTFGALGSFSSAAQLQNRKNDLVGALNLALTRIPAGSLLRVKLFLNHIVAGSGIDDTLEITRDGRQILVHGPIDCPIGQNVSELWVTATQASTGAIARARWSGVCTGQSQIWNATATIEPGSKRRFTTGTAQVCASAVFEVNKQSQTAKQWCTDAELFEQ